jgi:hypothetical protein
VLRISLNWELSGVFPKMKKMITTSDFLLISNLCELFYFSTAPNYYAIKIKGNFLSGKKEEVNPW